MATRLYLRAALAATSPTSGEKSAALPVGDFVGNSGTGFEDLSLSTTKGAAQTSKARAHGFLGHCDDYVARFSTPPLGAQTISTNTWTIIVAATQGHATRANRYLCPVIYVWRPSNTSVVGYVVDADTGIGSEWSTSETGQGGTFSGAQVTGVQQGDILVLEVWDITNPDTAYSASYTQTIYFDGTTDPTVGGATSDAASYLETPQNLTWAPVQTDHAVNLAGQSRKPDNDYAINLAGQYKAASAGGGGTITPGNSTNSGAAGGTAATSVSPTIPTGVQAGDVWVVTIGVEETLAGGSQTITPPGGGAITLISNDESYTPTVNPQVRLWTGYRVLDSTDVANAGTGPYSFGFSYSARYGWGSRAYRGVDQATPQDAAAVVAISNNVATYNPASTGITTVTDKAYVIGILVQASTTATHTAPGALTEQWETSGGRVTSYDDAEKTPAGATGTLTWTSTNNGPWVAHVIALRPGSGAVQTDHAINLAGQRVKVDNDHAISLAGQCTKVDNDHPVSLAGQYIIVADHAVNLAGQANGLYDHSVNLAGQYKTGVAGQVEQATNLAGQVLKTDTDHAVQLAGQVLQQGVEHAVNLGGQYIARYDHAANLAGQCWGQVEHSVNLAGQYRSTNDPNLLVWVSDTHCANADPGATYMNPTETDDLADHFNSLIPTAILHTGDTISEYSDIPDADTFKNNFFDIVASPLYISRGNHDSNDDTTDPPSYSFWNGRFPTVPAHAIYDWAGPRIRFIVFHSDRYESPTIHYHLAAAEQTWIESQVSGMPAGYRAILASHPPVVGNAPGSTHLGYIEDGGSTLLTYMAANADRVLAYIDGHQHVNMLHTTQDGITHVWGPAAAPNGNNAYVRMVYSDAAKTVTLTAYYSTADHSFAARDTAVFVPIVLNVPVVTEHSVSLAGQTIVQVDHAVNLGGQWIGRYEHSVNLASQVRQAGIEHSVNLGGQVRGAIDHQVSLAGQVNGLFEHAVSLAGQLRKADNDHSVNLAGQYKSAAYDTYDQSVNLAGQARATTTHPVNLAGQYLAALGGHYVSTTGRAGGPGTIGDPWTLAYAFSGAGGSLTPGETCWIRGGTYTTGTHFEVTSGGTGGHSGPNVVFKAYPGERAIIDKNVRYDDGVNAVVLISAGNVEFWNLEITSSVIDRDWSTNTQPLAFLVSRDYVKIINCVMHDTAQGIQGAADTYEGVYYGNLCYYNGGEDTDRGHGHGIYAQGGVTGDPTLIENNICLRNYGNDIQLYGTTPDIQNITLRKNIMADPGRLTRLAIRQESYNLQVETIASGKHVKGIIIDGNRAWKAGDSTNNAIKLGSYNRPNDDLQYINNWSANLDSTIGDDDGSAMAIHIQEFTNLTVTGNRFASGAYLAKLEDNTAVTALSEVWNTNQYYSTNGTAFKDKASEWESWANWKARTGFDAAGTLTASLPATNWVTVTPNTYEAGRAHISVYNWTHSATQAVDFSSFLSVGAAYEVRDAFNYYGPVVCSGIYAGGTVSIPMTGLTCAAPVNASTPSHPGNDFGAFIVLTTSGGAAQVDQIMHLGGQVRGQVEHSVSLGGQWIARVDHTVSLGGQWITITATDHSVNVSGQVRGTVDHAANLSGQVRGTAEHIANLGGQYDEMPAGQVQYSVWLGGQVRGAVEAQALVGGQARAADLEHSANLAGEWVPAGFSVLGSVRTEIASPTIRGECVAAATVKGEIL